MQKITPYLWFDKEAKDAAKFYTSIFPNSKIKEVITLHDTPSGDADTVNFEINGYSISAISAGPYFKLNPSISFMVNFDTSKDSEAKDNLHKLWDKLIEGGNALMALDKYPFSELYGWVQDKFGVTWQLILSDPKGEDRPFIVPSLMFTNNVSGKAEEATDFYLSVFEGKGESKKGIQARYPAGMESDKEGTLMYSDFMLLGQWFAAMDSAREHDYNFNEALSLLINCENQEEIDYYWEKLSAVPESEQCGWLKDKYGVSWQIAPANLDEMLHKGTPEQAKAVTEAFLKMKKFDLAQLQKVYDDAA